VRRSVRGPTVRGMTAHAYDLNQLHDDLLEQLELGRRFLDATEFLADGGETHQVARELIEAITDADSALSAALREEED